jgi:hypothetical protein
MPKDSARAGSVAYLTNSRTTVPKATYVPVSVPDDETTRAVPKGPLFRSPVCEKA